MKNELYINYTLDYHLEYRLCAFFVNLESGAHSNKIRI